MYVFRKFWNVFGACQEGIIFLSVLHVCLLYIECLISFLISQTHFEYNVTGKYLQETMHWAALFLLDEFFYGWTVAFYTIGQRINDIYFNWNWMVTITIYIFFCMCRFPINLIYKNVLNSNIYNSKFNIFFDYKCEVNWILYGIWFIQICFQSFFVMFP